MTGAAEGGFNGYSLNMDTEVLSGLGLKANPLSLVAAIRHVSRCLT